MSAHLEAREVDFSSIKYSLSQSIAYSCGDSIISEGDSLELIKRLPDQSILVQPPINWTGIANSSAILLSKTSPIFAAP